MPHEPLLGLVVRFRRNSRDLVFVPACVFSPSLPSAAGEDVTAALLVSIGLSVGLSACFLFCFKMVLFTFEKHDLCQEADFRRKVFSNPSPDKFLCFCHLTHNDQFIGSSGGGVSTSM